MAKKKENEFKYMNMPLHEGSSQTRHIKVDWSGLDYRSENDTGSLVYEKNISTRSAPCLTPSDKIVKKLDFGRLATTWNTPEDIIDNYTATDMTVNGDECYGIDFGDEFVCLHRTLPSTAITRYDIIEFANGEVIGGRGNSLGNKAYGNVKKICIKKDDYPGYINTFNEFLKMYKAYKIGSELSDRQLREIYSHGIYFDDDGYITTSVSAYKNLLFVCYYSLIGTAWRNDYIQKDVMADKGCVYPNCLIFGTENMEQFKLIDDDISSTVRGDVMSFPLVAADEDVDKKRKASDIPEIKTAAFTTLTPSLTLADYSSTSEVTRKCLFFPQSYSLEIDRVKNVAYKSEYRKKTYYSNNFDALYPFAFIDEFTDENIIYNVTENPFCEIPLLDDLVIYGKQKLVAYGEYNGGYGHKYKISNDKKENAAWILGRWRYIDGHWRPDGYDSDKKVKSSTLKSTRKVTGTPFLKDVCVHQSRLFGINDVGVYASAYGDYSDWTLDDADTYNSSNAWMSLLTSDEAMTGVPTAITVYQDAVIIFCENHVYEVRNKKNPFRIIDIFNEGCISSNACCVVNGYLLFANQNGARMYTGSKPKDIGYKLGFSKIYYASCGSDGINWYLYCETDKKPHNLFVYDTSTGLWSEKEISTRLISFATTSNGVFALDSNNKIYLINSNEFDGQEWACETDFTSGGTLDVKHIQKIQMLADVGVKSEIKIYMLTDDESFDELTVKEREERCMYCFLNNSENPKTVVIRVIPRKSANYKYKLRVSGTGYSKVYQADLTVRTGGGLFNGQV